MEDTRRPVRYRRRGRAGVAELPEPERAALAWIGEQYAVRGDVLAEVLARCGATPPGAVVTRWARSGLVERRRLLAGQAALVWPTRRGLGHTDLPYRARPPALGLAAHVHAVSLVRLGLEALGGRDWTSERRLFRERDSLDAHVADGRFRTPNGALVAVEVELSVKRSARLRRIVRDLTLDYDAVLYVVGDHRVAAAVTRAARASVDGDRVTVVGAERFALR